MNHRVCATVDVEDFAEGMAVLGHDVDQGAGAGDLGALLDLLTQQAAEARVTLFVVGRHAHRLHRVLSAFASAGHEVACHGPDHGRLPDEGLVAWLRRGREMVEQSVGMPVRGFRAPRFDLPSHGDLAAYRQQLAEAGFSYVSDTSALGPRSAVRELPVFVWHGLKLGGGSYQRLLPSAGVRWAARRSRGPVVLYYHSYDFDGSLPPLVGVRSFSVASQLVGRGRVAGCFSRLVACLGSETCAVAAG